MCRRQVNIASNRCISKDFPTQIKETCRMDEVNETESMASMDRGSSHGQKQMISSLIVSGMRLA
jgi:hypothetical protein